MANIVIVNGIFPHDGKSDTIVGDKGADPVLMTILGAEFKHE